MVKIVMGLKGSGKTKKLVEAVREAIKVGNGDVIVIEKEKNLTYDIPYQARLIHAGEYDIGSYEFLKGFICGIRAGNYDITHFFIDNFMKLVTDKAPESFAAFVGWLNRYSAQENLDFYISVTGDPSTVDESIKAFVEGD